MVAMMQFQKNARIVNTTGQELGQIERVVMNPGDKLVTHIVVDTSNLFKKEEKVVPVGLITATSEDQILLADEARNLKSLPAFEERRLVDNEEELEQPHSSGNDSSLIYGYPTPVMPVSQGSSGEKFVTRIEQNIPEGTVAMKEGARVISVEGKQVGNVERVLAEVPSEHITHLLISSGMFKKEARLIPVAWVNRFGENEVLLSVKKDSVKKLAATPTAD